jgi:hypothetical protein
VTCAEVYTHVFEKCAHNATLKYPVGMNSGSGELLFNVVTHGYEANLYRPSVRRVCRSPVMFAYACPIWTVRHVDATTNMPRLMKGMPRRVVSSRIVLDESHGVDKYLRERAASWTSN